jgi:hypothetical protein
MNVTLLAARFGTLSHRKKTGQKNWIIIQFCPAERTLNECEQLSSVTSLQAALRQKFHRGVL